MRKSLFLLFILVLTFTVFCSEIDSIDWGNYKSHSARKLFKQGAFQPEKTTEKSLLALYAYFYTRIDDKELRKYFERNMSDFLSKVGDFENEFAKRKVMRDLEKEGKKLSVRPVIIKVKLYIREYDFIEKYFPVYHTLALCMTEELSKYRFGGWREKNKESLNWLGELLLTNLEEKYDGLKNIEVSEAVGEKIAQTCYTEPIVGKEGETNRYLYAYVVFKPSGLEKNKLKKGGFDKILAEGEIVVVNNKNEVVYVK